MSFYTSARTEARVPSTDSYVLEPENSPQKIPKIIAAAKASAQSLDAHYTDRRQNRAPREAGFVLADVKRNPVYANLEAKKIVTYLDDGGFQSAWASLRETIFSVPDKRNSSSGSTSRVEFMSGRRKYTCLAIPL